MIVFTPDYTLKVGEEADSFLFNSYALEEYSIAKGIELSELYAKVQIAISGMEDLPDEFKGAKPFQVTDLADLLYYGNKSWCLYNSLPFTADKLRSRFWLDCMGGIAGQRDAFAAVIVAIATRMVSGEKKSHPTVNGSEANPLPGGTSLPEPWKVG